MHSRTPIVLACSLGMLAWQSEAAERPRVATPLDTIVVAATQSERTVGDVAATVSVVDTEEIERRNARSLKDLVRYEPGLSVRNEGARFGLAGLSIRGLDGNRVAMEVDGTPVADAFAIGSFSNAGRAAVDLDILKPVEIVRGPASALHGSDALAGIVGFVTQEPLDLLDGTARGMGRVRMGYDSVDRSRQATATISVLAV